MSFNRPPRPPVASALPARSLNGIGDSMLAGQSTYSVQSAPDYQAQLARVPAYTAGGAVSAGNLCQSGGLVYRCTTAGTTGGTAPTGTTTSADGPVVWTFVPTLSIAKSGTSALTWDEIYSGGRLHVDMEAGYGGIASTLLKVLVAAGGGGYAAGDTVVLNNGAAGTLQVAGGAVTGVVVTNPGYSTGTAFTATIITAAGTGAVLVPVQAGSGTFATPGALTRDMLAMLDDALASSVQVFDVRGGGNDVATVPVATIVANLRALYDRLQFAGRAVIARPIPPRATGLTAAMAAAIHRVNRFVRAYCRGEPWANPQGLVTGIVLADSTGYWTDGAVGTYAPVGGTGGVAGAMTVDGLHPSQRGAMCDGYVGALAAQRWTGPPAPYTARAYAADDGYDPVLNPSGNMLEGFPWQASTAYALGQQCGANGQVYRCVQAGTAAASGGPSGTGASITDGGAKWAWMFAARTSVFGSGTAGVITAAAGVTIAGALASGLSLVRNGGSASGTLNAAVESPWSNGQAGQRQSLAFSLGTGTATERWDLGFQPTRTVAGMNVQAADLGTTKFVAELELEVSGAQNLTRLQFNLQDAAAVAVGPFQGGAGRELLASGGEPVPWPNGGRIVLRTPPFVIPADWANLNWVLVMGFNAAGAAGSAQATIKPTYLALRRHGLA